MSFEVRSLEAPPFSLVFDLEHHSEFAQTRALQHTIAAKLAELEKLPAALLRAGFSPAGNVD